MAKANYICTKCGKQINSENHPSSCPRCGAASSKIQRCEGGIEHDEMLTTLDRLRTLLDMLNGYVQQVRGLNASYEDRRQKCLKSHTDQDNSCAAQQNSELTGIRNTQTQTLNAYEEEYKRTLDSEARMAKSIQDEERATVTAAIQYRDGVVRQVEGTKKHLDDILAAVQKAEAHILPKRYHRMVKANEPATVEISAGNMEGIMAMNPMNMAKAINELYMRFLRRMIRANEINQKINEFYAMKLKAWEFYRREIALQDGRVPEAEAKMKSMQADAGKRMRTRMAEHDAQCSKSKEKYVQACSAAKSKYDKQYADAQARWTDQKRRLAEQHQQELAALDKEKKQALMEAYQTMQRTVLATVPPQPIAEAASAQKARAKRLRSSFAPSNAEPENITVGSLEYKLDAILGNRLISMFMTNNYSAVINGNSFVFPFTIGMNQNLCLMFKYGNERAALAKDHIQTICLTAFLETPPSKMRFHFFDPLKSGQSFAVFKHFEDDLARSYNVILGGIQTDATSIERQLQIVVDHIKTMQVNTFKGQYNNIRDYNAANPLNPQPYNIVGIMDFPAGFTPKSIDLLQQIVATGKECGVYAVIMCNTDSIKTADARIGGLIKNIEDLATVYTLREKGYYLEDKSGIDENMIFTIDPPISVQQIVQIAPSMKQGIKDAGRIVIDYKHIAPPAERQYRYTTDEGIVIPIGMSGASDIQYLTLGQPGSQSVHALIAGQIGSGKSRLLHAIITSCILQYPKDELELYLVDFKSGTEFKIYADYKLPNFKVIAIESEQEFGLSVLQYIEKESQRRAQLFNSSSVSDITSYNHSPAAAANGKLPRILVVIDEFHELFNSANASASAEASRLLDNILRLKRSFGVHVILCTQSVRGMSEVDEAAMAQIAVRIALKCPKEDADILLGDGSDAMAQIEENDAGSAIYLPAISEPKTNNRFRVGFISPEAHGKLLKQIEDHYAGQDQSKWNTRVLVSDVADSRDSVFQEYLRAGRLPEHADKLSFGESLNIDRALTISFPAGRNENMLLAGKDAQKAENLLFFITLALVLTKLKAMKEGGPCPQIYLFNFSSLDDVVTKHSLQEMAMLLPDYIESASADDAVEKLSAVYELYQNKTDPEAPVWVIISNFGLASDFQSSVYSSTSQGFAMLEELLRSGPARGVHVIGWNDDLTLFRQKYPNLIDLFKKRIAFNLSDEEALAFADVVKDPSISKNNAVFYEAGRGKQKFRPYATPSDTWFNEIINRITEEEIV